jgi:L-2-hydroxyglutarate oxidase LhgO
MEKVDVLVIGAGIVGAAVARAFARRGRSVLLLERQSQAGTGTTSRNSGVVHAGLYYATGSLKAKLCVEGRRSLYEYCIARAIPHWQCGKLIVATHRRQIPTLVQLQAQARANGVTDTRLILDDPYEIRAMEPALETCLAALYSPSTGIVDSHALLTHLLFDSSSTTDHNISNGSDNPDQTCLHVMNATVTNGGRSSSSACAASGGALPVQVDHELWLHCTTVVNCAGLHAPAIANLFLHNSADQSQNENHQDPTTRTQQRRHYFAKGNYFRLVLGNSSSSTAVPVPFSRLIYPVPDQPGGLGIHATMDPNGSLRFGPDVEWIDPTITCPDQIDLRPSIDRLPHFYKAIRQYWPALPDDCLEPDYAGLRPKLHHPDVPVPLPGHDTDQTPPLQHDFCIEGPATHGIPGLINLLGIESPGLTSCLAIAEYCTAIDTVK